MPTNDCSALAIYRQDRYATVRPEDDANTTQTQRKFDPNATQQIDVLFRSSPLLRLAPPFMT
jgi:hypothetical protein